MFSHRVPHSFQNYTSLFAMVLCAALISLHAGIAAAAPDEIHWTIKGQTSVTFDWRSSESTIRFGLTSAYGQTATASTPSPVPFSSAGPFWEAKLTGLQENTLYHYSIGSGPDHTFRTPPPRGTSDFTIMAEGDIGDASYSRMPIIQSMIAAGAPVFVLMVGDLTYGNAHGQPSVDRHFNDVMGWSQDAAYMPAWGNHEWDIPSADDLRNYKGRFDFPNAQTSPGSPSVSCCGEDWYWFDYGNVRFIAYPEPWTGAWSDWRTKAITVMDAAQSDPAIKFIVTYGHRPAYSSGHHPGNTTLASYLDGLGATHSKYVLNLNGHSHNYERTYPRSGVVHITVGTGGSSLEEDGSCLWLTCAKPSWSEYRAMHLGPLKLHFTPTSIEGSFLCGPSGGGTNDVTCSQGSVMDAFVIGVPSADRVPVVTAPTTATVAEGSPLTVNVTASDPDGQAITNLSAAGTAVTAGAAFTKNGSNTSGTLSWTPGFTQAGSYSATFTATNALSSSVSTAVTVTNTNRAPVVTAPASASGAQGTLITFTVTAADPDGDAITTLTAAGTAVTAGGAFTSNAAHTAGTFNWTPSSAQAGSYSATFTATNAQSSSATTAVTVTNTNRAPVVTAPATASGAQSTLITFTVAASDPDADAITTLTASGTAITAGGAFTSNAAHTAGTFNWTPSSSQAGSYSATFTAANALSGSATTAVTVTNTNRAPVVTAPATASGAQSTLITFTVAAGDPDGDAITTLTAAGTAVTAGGAFTSNAAHTAGTFNWTPSSSQAGSYSATFTATNALSGSATTVITVQASNRLPLAALSVTPATGNAPLGVTADASGSSDPDGSIASYRFDFGDGTIVGPQAGASATHTYAAGDWKAVVLVTDNAGGTDTDSASVSSTAAGSGPNLVGNPSFESSTTGWIGNGGGVIQRVAGGYDGGYSLETTGPASTAMFGVNDSPNWVTTNSTAGAVYRFAAWVRSATATGQSQLRVREYTGGTLNGAIYSPLLTLSPTWQLVTIDYTATVGGSTLDLGILDRPDAAGEVFQTDNISFRDVTGGAAASAPVGQPTTEVALEAVVAPNPLNPEAILTFTTSPGGACRLRIYDASGRFVRTLVEEALMPAGRHAVRFNGRDAAERRLASGVYFYELEAPNGHKRGRFVIMR